MDKKIDISNIVLYTERLALRAFRQDDLDDFYEYARVDGVGEMAGWKHHTSKSDSQIVLNKFIENRKTFAITLNGKVIGSIGIEKTPIVIKNQEHLIGKQLGFVLGKKYWGQGFMPEACKAVIKYLFQIENLDYITCGYFEYNLQSKRVQEKCGFKYLLDMIIENSESVPTRTKENILLKSQWQKLSDDRT